MQPGFRWVRPPSVVAREIERYGERVLVAVHAVAEYVGVKMQNEARVGARWHDRTGNARGGVFYAVDGLGKGVLVGEVRPGDAAAFERDRESGATVSGDGERLVIVLGHTMFYGKFLELEHGGRYAIVMSTIETNLPVLEGMLRDLFR